ncbi:unnamed protein product [Ectocarpus sp. 12 AP-2014]
MSSLFVSTAELKRNLAVDIDRSEQSDEEIALSDDGSEGDMGIEYQSFFAGSSESDSQRASQSGDGGEGSAGFFQGVFGGDPGGVGNGAEGGDGEISQYWQNYDLSISEAPKLFSDAEFQAVKRIQGGLKVLVLRKRLQERITARNREREVRAAVRVQAIFRGIATRASLPALREQHGVSARVKRTYKLFKRELRSEGFPIHLYRTKDGALRRVVLKPDNKLTSLCWSMGVAKVKSGRIPLIALKRCYSGYPKSNFPTKSMQARATPLPDRSKTFTIQVDTGKVYVFVTTDDIHKKLVKGLQSVIDEISSPDSFYFDATGVLRRVTSSIFDDRGNVAQREAMKKERQARFKFRQAEAEARLEPLRPEVCLLCFENN